MNLLQDLPLLVGEEFRALGKAIDFSVLFHQLTCDLVGFKLFIMRAFVADADVEKRHGSSHSENLFVSSIPPPLLIYLTSGSELAAALHAASMWDPDHQIASHQVHRTHPVKKPGGCFVKSGQLRERSPQEYKYRGSREATLREKVKYKD